MTNWVLRAGSALTGFYNESKGVFWRENSQKYASPPDRNRGYHPTSTNRAFLALREYRRFLLEQDASTREQERISEILREIAKKYLRRLLASSKKVRKSKTNDVNMFTDSQILMSLAILPDLKQFLTSLNLAKIAGAGRSIAAENIQLLRRWKGGKISEKDDVHDFVTLHLVRALDAYLGRKRWQGTRKSGELRDRIKEDVLRMLAFHFSGVHSKFDPSELSFSLALLNRYPTPDTHQLTQRSIQSIVETQSQDGSWPTSRFVSYQGNRLLHVASYEVALTLTDLAIRKLSENEFDICEQVLPALSRAFDLVRSYYNVVGTDSGWVNDHSRKRNLLESWSTAIVLTFLIHYHDLLLNLRQYSLLKKYEGKAPENPSLPPHWPDMSSLFRRLGSLQTKALDSILDPSDSRKLTKEIKDNVVIPIGKDWIQRPQVASFIFFGPSGTGKTSIITAIAESLRWPLVTLSPQNFLNRGGMEGFEASATEIFVDLLRLRRVVVLFDECEEFFKRRPELSQNLGSRTTGAFITAGMLPRLQRLRKGRWILFSLATNSGLEALDPAVTRQGRFDWTREIPHPSLAAQMRYVRAEADRQIPEIISALRKYQRIVEAAGASNPPKVSFQVLRDMLRQIKLNPRELDVSELFELLDTLVRQQSPSPAFQVA